MSAIRERHASHSRASVLRSTLGDCCSRFVDRRSLYDDRHIHLKDFCSRSDDGRSVLCDAHSQFRDFRSLGSDSALGTCRGSPLGGRLSRNSGVFSLDNRCLFALRRLAFAISATFIRTSGTSCVRAHANNILVCAIGCSFSHARRSHDRGAFREALWRKRIEAGRLAVLERFVRLDQRRCGARSRPAAQGNGCSVGRQCSCTERKAALREA